MIRSGNQGQQRAGLSRRLLLRFAAAGGLLTLAGCSTFEASPPSPFAGAPSSGSNGSEKTRQVLEQVMREAHSKFHFASDRTTYGQSDYWSVPSEANDWKGDCEDFALMCRELLRARGVRGSLLLTGWTEDGTYHCVLYLDGWIIDNRYQGVMSNTDLQALGYRWHKAGLEDGRWFRVTAKA